MTQDSTNVDYNAQLAQEHEDIRDKVRRGMLPRETIIAFLYHYAKVEELAKQHSRPLAIFKLVMDNAINDADLTERQRYCMEQHYIEGMTQVEVAQQLDITQQAVGKHLRLAIDKIRENTKGVDYDFDRYKR